MRTRPAPRSKSAAPINHSSESSAPVKATPELVVAGFVRGAAVPVAVAAGGDVAADVAGAGVTVTLPGT
jgi:hypothetical protein